MITIDPLSFSIDKYLQSFTMLQFTSIALYSNTKSNRLHVNWNRADLWMIFPRPYRTERSNHGPLVRTRLIPIASIERPCQFNCRRHPMMYIDLYRSFVECRRKGSSTCLYHLSKIRSTCLYLSFLSCSEQCRRRYTSIYRHEYWRRDEWASMFSLSVRLLLFSLSSSIANVTCSSLLRSKMSSNGRRLLRSSRTEHMQHHMSTYIFRSLTIDWATNRQVHRKFDKDERGKWSKFLRVFLTIQPKPLKKVLSLHQWCLHFKSYSIVSSVN